MCFAVFGVDSARAERFAKSGGVVRKFDLVIASLAKPQAAVRYRRIHTHINR
jgi:hypothetical protein